MASSFFPGLMSGTFGDSLNVWRSEYTRSVHFSFQKIVDTTTVIPDFGKNFCGFGLPALNSYAVAFVGHQWERKTNQVNSGIYALEGGVLRRLIDPFDAPFGYQNSSLYHFMSLSLSGDNIAFYGTNFDQSCAGIYARIGGRWLTVADTSTPIPKYPICPQQTSYFHHFSSFSIHEDIVMFGGSETVNDDSGIYCYQKERLEPWLLSDTTIPQQKEPFGNVLYPVCRHGNYVFYGSNSSFQGGIYVRTENTLHCIADTTTQIPGSHQTFAYFPAAPRVSCQAIAFIGADAALNTGIYISINGRLETVVDTQTPVPNGQSTFSFLYDSDEILYALDGTAIAFVGYDASNPFSSLGIYTTLGGTLSTVIDVNDSLDHKIITSLRLGPEGFFGGAIAFLASFSDGSQGIYVARRKQ